MKNGAKLRNFLPKIKTLAFPGGIATPSRSYHRQASTKKLDRISRNPTDREKLADLKKKRKSLSWCGGAARFFRLAAVLVTRARQCARKRASHAVVHCRLNMLRRVVCILLRGPGNTLKK
eukprot:gene19216-biopygen13000